MARRSRSGRRPPRADAAAVARPSRARLHLELLDIVRSFTGEADLHGIMEHLFRIVERHVPTHAYYVIIRLDDQYQVLFETDLDDRDRRIFFPVPRLLSYNKSPSLRKLHELPHLLINRSAAEIRRLEEADRRSALPAGEMNTVGNPHRRSASLLYVPVRAGRETIGMVVAQNYVPRIYRPEHVETLKTVAAYVSHGVQTLLALRRISRAAEEALRRANAALDDVLKYAGEGGPAVRAQIDQAETAISRITDLLPDTSA